MSVGADDAAARRLRPQVSGAAVFDRVAALATRLLGVPSAQACLLTDGAALVGEHGDTLVVADAVSDPRTADLPGVRSGRIGTYLGVPLTSGAGDVVGTLCVFGPDHHAWTDDDVVLLEHLAVATVAELELAALSREYDTSRARWDLALAAGEIGSFDWDLVTGELDWDERLIAMYGYDVGDVGFDRSFDSVRARLHPDDAAEVARILDDAIATVGPLHVTYRIVLPDGAVRWLEARGRVLPGATGAAGRVLGASWDVTDQQESEARADRVLDSMTVGFIATNAEWQITYVNAEAERLSGLTRNELVGRSLWSTFPETVGSAFGDTYVRVAATGVPETFEAYYPAPLNAWYDVRVYPDDDGIAVYFLDVTARHDAQELLQLSVQVSEQLVGAASVDDAVAALARTVVPRLADWAIVSLVDPDGSVRDVRTAHRDPRQQPALDRYSTHRLYGGGSGTSQQALRSGDPVILTSDLLQHAVDRLQSDPAKQAIRELAPGTAVIVPMLAGSDVAGVLSLMRGGDRPPMDARELGVTMSICRRAGMIIDNARLYAAQAAAAEHDRTVARALQDALLTRLPEPDHLHLTARYLTAAQDEQVGGDWYDAVISPEGATTIMIGDVVGHDIRAAAVMGQLRSMLRLLALEVTVPPSVMLTRLDHAVRSLELHTLATVLTGRIEQTRTDQRAGVRTLRWSSAGHPPPVLVLADGTARALAGRSDLLLGVDADAPRRDHLEELPPGATILLYTDGLIETRTHDIDHGIARLVTAAARHHERSPDDLLDAVLLEMVGDQPCDDVAILAVRLHPEDEPRPAEAGPRHD